MNRVLLLLLNIVFLLVGCSVAQKSAMKKTIENNNTVEIELSRISVNRWSVTYNLPEAVKAVVFQRQTNQFRHTHWKIKTPDLKFRKIDNQECIASDKARFQKFTVEFQSYFKHTPKDYEFFRSFSDGGLIIYTGHLYIHPVQERYKNLLHVDEEKNWEQKIASRPQNRSLTVINGKIHKKPFEWIDSERKGTYIYFGKNRPLESDRMVAVVDQKMPTWIKVKMNDFLPRLFDLYFEKTKEQLSFRPIVFFNYAQINRPGFSYSGGILPGLVQLSIEGEGWKAKDQNKTETILKFFAHEAAHFWNGEMFNNSEPQAAWLHEGGADAFAYFALNELGIIDQAKLNMNFEWALNSCLNSLAGEPLNRSAELRRYRNYYDCGAFLWYVTDQKMKKNNSTLFRFWQKMFRNSEVRSRMYSSADFHKLLKNEFDEKNLSQLIEDLEWNGSIDTHTQLFKIAANAGINLVSAPEEAPRKYWSRSFQEIVADIMKEDCGGYVDVARGGAALRVGGNSRCKILKKDEYIFVGALGKSFRKGGYELQREIIRACRKDKKIDLFYRDGKASISVPCAEQSFSNLNWYKFM